MEYWTDDTGQKIQVHDKERCEGRNCSVHNPSQHHMAEFKRHWRSDRGIMERVCEHGIGHPDPDDVAFRAGQGDTDAVHGCDSCCVEKKAPPISFDFVNDMLNDLMGLVSKGNRKYIATAKAHFVAHTKGGRPTYPKTEEKE